MERNQIALMHLRKLSYEAIFRTVGAGLVRCAKEGCRRVRWPPATASRHRLHSGGIGQDLELAVVRAESACHQHALAEMKPAHKHGVLPEGGAERGPCTESFTAYHLPAEVLA